MTAALTPKVDARSAPLYLLVDDYSKLLDLIAEAGGEVTPEVGAALEASDGQIRTKMESTIRYVKNRQALRDAALAESKALKEYADGLDRGIEGIKRYVLDLLVKADIRKVETAVGVVRWQQNGRPSIRWDRPMEELPGAFLRLRTEVDGEKVYEAYRASQVLPDGFVVELGKHLRIGA